MLRLLLALLGTAKSAFKPRRDLVLENLAPRQQLSVLRLQVTRARPTNTDRAFWVVLSQLWNRWTDSLVFVKPETVFAWLRLWLRPLLEVEKPPEKRATARPSRGPRPHLEDGAGEPVFGEHLASTANSGSSASR